MSNKAAIVRARLAKDAPTTERLKHLSLMQLLSFEATAENNKWHHESEHCRWKALLEDIRNELERRA